MRTFFTLDPSQTNLNWTYVHPRVTLLKLPGKKDRSPMPMLKDIGEVSYQLLNQHLCHHSKGKQMLSRVIPKSIFADACQGQGRAMNH